MIKAAIQYLTELGIAPRERFVKEDDRLFSVNSDGVSKEILPRITRADDVLRINTLSGLVGYVKANLERQGAQFYLQVYDEKTVLLKGVLDSDGGRETLVQASAIVPRVEFDSYMDTENLIIALQSKFVLNTDSEILLQAIGNVKEENVKNTGDDGISQSITIKTGITAVAEAKVPNPVTLAPYRTFLEVAQPESAFVFRMKDGPRGAIFEADGGAWRNQAITNIREYLKVELELEIKLEKITIIA